MRDIPQILFSILFSLSNFPSPSATMIKRKGERGSHCLIPLEALKGVEGEPLTKIKKKADETIFMTQLVQSSKKPKDVIIPTKKFEFNLSYSFERSSFRSISEVFVVLSNESLHGTK